MEIELAPDVHCEPWRADLDPDLRPDVTVGFWRVDSVVAALTPSKTRLVMGWWRPRDLVTIFIVVIATREFLVQKTLHLTSLDRILCAGDVVVVLQKHIARDGDFAFKIVVLDALTLVERGRMPGETLVPSEEAISSDGRLLALLYPTFYTIIDLHTFKRIHSEFVLGESTNFRFVPEPGRSDGVLHLCVGTAVRLVRQERVALFAVMAAPSRSLLRAAFLNKSGDNRVLVRVLGWLVR